MKKGFIGEFKEFISKGNVIDMAVGIIIGGAFTAIVNSLVKEVIMPVVGLIIGGINFASLKLELAPAKGDIAAVTLNYGTFLQAVVDFLLVALVIFILIKQINRIKKKKEEAAAVQAKSAEVEILEEIRDLLKK